MPREPGYRLHKPSGQAYVRLHGKMIYLGPHGSEESRREYEKRKAEWLANRTVDRVIPPGSPTSPTMAQVCLAYLDHAEAYYGKASSELEGMRAAIRPVSELYATHPAERFGPREYKTVRDWWLAKPTHKKRSDGKFQLASRQYANKQMKRLVRVLKWAVGEGLIPPAVHQAVKCVDPLRRGRTTAPEAEPVKPVPQADVDATLAKLTDVVADMVRLQLLLGCRPGEIVALTPAMVDRSGDVWTITMVEHKTAWRGKTRTIYAGPKAQGILARYLLRPEDKPCFSPSEAMAQHRQAKHEKRTTPLSCGNKPGSNVKRGRRRKEPGEAYTTQTYGRAVKSAAKRAKVSPWAPNRLRHSRATEIRKQFGLEWASAVLGHSEITTTQVYAEQDRERAVTVARAIG